MQIPTEFFTWQMLATMGGASLAVMVLVQLTKEFVSFLPVRTYAWICSFVVLNVAALATGSLTWEIAVLNLLNGAVVAFAAMGEYQVLKAAGVMGSRSY